MRVFFSSVPSSRPIQPLEEAVAPVQIDLRGPHLHRAKRSARSRVARAACCLFLFGGCVLSSVPQAQAKDEQIQKIDQFFETQFPALAATDSQAGLRAGRQFLADNPKMDAWNRVQFYSQWGLGLYFQSPAERRAQAAELALGVLEEGLIQASPVRGKAQAGGKGSGAAPEQLLLLVNAKTKVLLGEKRWEAAGEFLGQSDAIAARSTSIAVRSNGKAEPRFFNYLLLKIRFLKEQQRAAEVPAMLTRFASAQIAARHQVELPLCEFLTNQLIEANQVRDALSWAKLGFLYCGFDDASISRATQLLTQAWLANDFARDKVTAFAAAQTDAGAPNPLEAVALPTLDTAALQGFLTSPKVKETEKVQLLLLTGQAHEAMLQARRTLLSEPASERGLREAALVFKASDGDVARANLFLAFYQNHQGQNPMSGFLEETAAQNAKPEVKPEAKPNLETK